MWSPAHHVAVPREVLDALEPYNEPNVGRDMLRLHFNENLFLPEEYYREVLVDVSPDEARYYTEPLNRSFNRFLEESFGLPEGSAFATLGADEALRLLMHLPLLARWRVVVLEPTYGMVGPIAASLRLRAEQSLLTETFDVDVDDVVRRGPALVYVCSPNNPTGNVPKGIEELASRLEGLLVVDEAYWEYRGESHVDLLEYRNVALVRTFSKAWGLAGIRVGYLAADPTLVEFVSRISLPHNLPAHSMAVVRRALGARRYVEDAVARAREAYAYFTGRLRGLGIGFLPSVANFVTVLVDSPSKVAEALLARGIAVRDVSSKPRCGRCLRITLAPPHVMDRVLDSLASALEDLKSGRGGAS